MVPPPVTTRSLDLSDGGTMRSNKRRKWPSAARHPSDKTLPNDPLGISFVKKSECDCGQTKGALACHWQRDRGNDWLPST